VQRVPELFSYLQEVVDTSNQPGQYVLTSSHNFLLLEKITQSLAGRVSLFKLLPLSMRELADAGLLPDNANAMIFNGCYPRLYEHTIAAAAWYPNYIMTYLERDVRQIVNVSDLSTFQRFLHLCAGRCGQLLNYSELSADCGISVNTVKSWISILEASFIIYLLQPHHQNYSKRVIKSPKLYFYDTGLVCSLLGLENCDQVQNHYLRGALFENMIIIELLKHRYNQGKRSNLYFWRDSAGHEIDCIQEFHDKLLPIEIKSSQTFNQSFVSGLKYYQQLSGAKELKLIYGGDQNLLIHDVQLIPWNKLE
jgi:hypothetical protein